MNNLIFDKDIYIIEKKYFKEYIKELIESDTTYGNSIVFPMTGSKAISYSDSYLKFNYNMNSIDNRSIYIKKEDGTYDLGTDVYEILEKKNNKLVPKKIKCNKIRLYHPLTKKSLNAIIDVNNYINNIHFHYLCKSITDYSSNSETEIKYANNTYSEYIDIYYPNIEDIFKINEDGSYSSFYIEDLEIVASTKNEKFINTILSSSEDLEQCEEYEGKQIVPMNLFIQPFRIIEEYAANNALNYDDDLSNDEKVFVKLYLKNSVVENNYVKYPINITLFPYNNVDRTINMYLLDDYMNATTIVFNNPYRFKLMSRLGFSDGIISVVTMFDYPNKSYFYNLAKEYNLSNESKTTPIKEAYKYYNCVDDDNYLMFTNENIVKELEEIDNVTDIGEETMRYVVNTLGLVLENNDNKSKGEITDELLKVNKVKILNAWKNIMKETIVKEYEEEYKTPGNFLGFKIEIATDLAFKHIIYDKNYRLNFCDIDDFAFKLNGIFKSWVQKPEQLLCRTVFYDRVIGTKIIGNLIVISKEWFKYLVNDSIISRMNMLSLINKNKGENIGDMKVIELKEDNINFINNINCIVSKQSDAYNNMSSSLKSNQKIIFKPIFYRVSDLQNIRIRENTVQNIGLNLMKYMTKVEAFKLKINNVEYVESSRNDAFVIFKINANDINIKSGRYDITNQDDEYISTGSYVIY